MPSEIPVQGETVSFFGELKRRNVFKVAVAYAIVGWLLIEIAATVFPVLQLPAWTVTLVTMLLLLGFPVALILSWAYDLTPDGVSRTRRHASGEDTARPSGRTLDLAIIGALVLALGLVIYNYESVDRPAVGGAALDAPAEQSAPRRERLPNSVAVLPFDNLSLDPENAFFAAGIHESTLNQLAKISDLNVIARTSVLQYEEDPPPIPDIAAALNVEMVMEGSVRYANDRVLITAQLIDGDTGAHLWSAEYNRGLADIFAVQAEIARAIASALEAEFSETERNEIERPLTASPEAYAFYLQALAVVENITNADTTVDASAAFHDYLDRAIELDPTFATAHALKAVDYATSTIRAARLTDELTAADKIRLAREHADRALDLDPALGLAHDALGQSYRFTWRWDEAEDAFERAVELAPNDPQILQQYATYKLNAGEPEAALTAARRLRELAPSSELLPYQLMLTADYESAIALAREQLELNPSQSLLYWVVGMSEAFLGDIGAALDSFRLFETLAGERLVAPYILAEMAYAYARIGSIDDANRVLLRVEEMNSEFHIGAGNWALLYLAVGDEERALDWLRRAADDRSVDGGYINLATIATNAFSDLVLEQREFVEVRGRLGFGQ